jgi:predicted dehydrogenase
MGEATQTTTDLPLNPISIIAPPSPPRLLIIGAGSRGNAYSKAVVHATKGIIVGVVDPIPFKRRALGQKYIWRDSAPLSHQEFEDWSDFVSYELERRRKEGAGEDVESGVDGVFVCVQDQQHKPCVLALAPLHLHIMCEKPLATTLADCVDIYNSLPRQPESKELSKIFALGHVLRYSPHNLMLHDLLINQRVIGDVLSINHTEPVGWWHFAHSFVRGNWRDSKTSAPSLLTKSCHDIDVLMWLMCAPPSDAGYDAPPHLPSEVSSFGARQFFTKSVKPKLAGDATNCLSCPAEKECLFSAKKIYVGRELRGLATGNTGWPVKVVVEDIEEIVKTADAGKAEEKLLAALAEDYDDTTPRDVVDSRSYYGRCVFEASNDVCDDQTVNLTWSPTTSPGGPSYNAKQATFHMVSHTARVCERYTNIYGTTGEIYADSEHIVVTDFREPVPASSGTEAGLLGGKDGFKMTTHYPKLPGGGHGGGDAGLASAFVKAIERSKAGEAVKRVQREELGCSVEEMVRSHAVVFAAEDAREGRKIVDFEDWWKGVGDSKHTVGVGKKDVEGLSW